MDQMVLSVGRKSGRTLNKKIFSGLGITSQSIGLSHWWWIHLYATQKRSSDCKRFNNFVTAFERIFGMFKMFHSKGHFSRNSSRLNFVENAKPNEFKQCFHGTLGKKNKGPTLSELRLIQPPLAQKQY